MAAPKIRVRSTLTGHEALIAPQALRHFPDYERVDDAPETAESASDAGAVGPKPSKPAKPADKQSPGDR